MRTRIGIALIVTAVALGGSLIASGPAGAAAVHTVTVTPSTGLVDGQTVTVSGTGFDETPIIYDWAVAICNAAISFGEPVKTVAECFREFRDDHEHRLRYRLHRLLACVLEAVRNRHDR